ncbi:LysR family transcriptional regulator [Pseudooceanicola sp. 216_PA32_1]|uniref:LysR family transcriptional regulator n=1 Tax=Pseudooceanicola pacificus TaxID=2676438 RepID=A0A844W8D2_9RHOB|nr:LysR substrate-binding domain-containing protein [Pseudooceanicola pacificus]MWB79084.1 LysR family transcriptional regulator [Pseudooceanicola pacificus]
MLNLTALNTFHQVARNGGIAAAASQLNVTDGAIRYQIRRLEEDLGEQLLVRSKRTLTLTSAGLSLFERLNHAFRDMERACQSLTSTSGMDGELNIACAPAFSGARLPSVIRAYCQQYPLMTVRVFPIGMFDESMDVVISYGERTTPGMREAILRDEMYFPVCRPELKYEWGITSTADLANCIALHADQGGDWMRLLTAASPASIQFAQQVYFPNAAVSLQAARRGCGVAVGTSILCADDLRSGTLVRLLDIEVPAPNPYFVIQPGQTHKDSAERFVDTLMDQLENG